jgi:hypothetical protein
MAKRLTKANTDRMIDRLKKQIEKAGFAVAVGVEDVVHEPSGLRMSELASIHEYGTLDGKIPARAPFGKTMATKRKRYPKLLKETTKQVLAKQNLAAANRLGAMVAADVQRMIAAGLTPPLKKRTVARKGSSKPLIDTGAFRQSITWKVFKRGDI